VAALGCVPHAIPLSRNGLNPLRDLQLLAALLVLMLRLRPAQVLAYTIKPVIYGMLAARLARVPRRTALVTGLGYAFQGQQGRAPSLVQRIAMGLYRLALAGRSTVVFQNPDDRALMVAMGMVEASRTRLVNGSGVPLQEFAVAPFPPLGPGDQAVHFLLIARLIQDKGVREYAAAARLVRQQHPQAVFHIVGWIDTNPTAITQAELDGWVAEGLIEFHGFLDDVRPVLAQCHVYVLPSYREGTPRSVLEAMACGRAIVTTDAPGCRETVVEALNGFLVPVQDAGALAAACRRFIEAPRLIAAMGASSRRLAEEKFDVRAVNRAMFGHMQLDLAAGGSA
jgi:glycosyltransferase involved in cell wall biosynthesis